MNDRYLYRAKRKNWRELPKDEWWVEGYYAYMKPYHYIMAKENYDSWIEIDEKTLCACTGLKDKNGKLIWENDILLQKTTEKHWCKWKCSGVVKYGEYDYNAGEYGYKSIGFYVEPIIKNGDTTRIWCGLNQEYLVDECYPYEVIGNIFDNPELLEV